MYLYSSLTLINFRILRNLARNCYDYHINEIFFSIDTEYTDYTGDSPLRLQDLDIRRHKVDVFR